MIYSLTLLHQCKCILSIPHSVPINKPHFRILIQLLSQRDLATEVRLSMLELQLQVNIKLLEFPRPLPNNTRIHCLQKTQAQRFSKCSTTLLLTLQTLTSTSLIQAGNSNNNNLNSIINNQLILLSLRIRGDLKIISRGTYLQTMVEIIKNKKPISKD
jgi:hypothetical protein